MTRTHQNKTKPNIQTKIKTMLVWTRLTDKKWQLYSADKQNQEGHSLMAGAGGNQFGSG